MGLKLENVELTYDTSKRKIRKKLCEYALKEVDFNLNLDNEFVAIVGHTGSGKSTLVQILNVLIKPTTGRYLFLDQEITKKTKLKPIRKKVGLVFQFPEYQIFEDTVLKDISFGPKNFRLDNVKTRAISAAKILKIENLLERSPYALSGGQMRKVAIAGILASDPDVLILDEPTAGLDGKSKLELMIFLKELNEKFHKSIVLISHDMDIVAEYCKRVVVLSEGKIVFDDKKDKLFRDEAFLEKFSLSLPRTIEIMKQIKKAFNLKLDIYQYNLEDCAQEIKKHYE